MPRVNNHSEKFKKAQQNYARLEAIKTDVAELKKICAESLHLSRTTVLSFKRRQQLLKTTSNVINSLLGKINVIQTESGAVAGTGDMNYVFNRLSRECDLNTDGTFNTDSLFQSPPLQASNDSITPTPPGKRPAYSRNAKRKSCDTSSKVYSPSIDDLIPPSDGYQYNPPSVLRAINPIEKKRKIVKKIVDADLVPCTDRTIHRLIKKEANGEKIPAKFNALGRPGKIELKPLFMTIQETLDASGEGSTATRRIVDDAIDTVYSQKQTENGKDPGFTEKMGERSKRRYQNVVKQITSGRAAVRTKNSSRQAAEQSLRSTVSYLHTVCATHYRIDPNGIGDKSICNATTGANENYGLVSSFHDGAALYSQPPEVICSTDDSACFVSKEMDDGKVEWHYVLDNRISSKKSFYTLAKETVSTGFKAGIKFRYTHTIQESGGCFPISMQMLHLTVRELPIDMCPTGILMGKFPGLCIGSGQDIRNNHFGTVMFVREGTDETLIFKNYVLHVFLPHVELIRQSLGFVRSDANAEIPDELTVVSWMDGGLPQLKNIITPELHQMYSDLKIIVNKHSAARSTVEQPCDVASTFRTQRRKMKSFATNNFADCNNDAQRRAITTVLEYLKKK